MASGAVEVGSALSAGSGDSGSHQHRYKKAARARIHAKAERWLACPQDTARRWKTTEAWPIEYKQTRRQWTITTTNLF